ncbi:hypothetical protein SALBM311S_12784 [Streptomyces alboniger]
MALELRDLADYLARSSNDPKNSKVVDDIRIQRTPAGPEGKRPRRQRLDGAVRGARKQEPGRRLRRT